MADSGALRVRRARLHKAGDHSLCRRCPAVRGGAAASLSLAAAPPTETELDPVSEMRLLAAELHEAYRAEPGNSALARELRMTLAELMPKDAGKPDADLTGLFGALQA